MSIRQRPDTICKNCGKPFYVPNKPHQIFCCHPCASEYNSAHPSPKLHQPRPSARKGVFVQCGFCGKDVYRHQCRLTMNDLQFCDAKCHNAFQGRNKVHLVCKICGKDVIIPRSYLKFGNRKYCSVSCRNNDIDFYARLLLQNQYIQVENPSRLDKAGYLMLDELKLNYQKQYLLDDRICVDAFLPEYDLIIQFDGDYWHGHPSKAPFDERQLRRMQIDKNQNRYFENCGYKLLRIWASDLKRNKEQIKSKILEYCQ